jgi:hypothetical protein
MLELARLYAKESLEYTHSYDGWEDQNQTVKQMQRILVGRFGQRWVAEICRLNNIPMNFDESDVKISDDLDMTIIDTIVDVKTTATNSISCQVNAALKSHNVDAYCFLRTDKKLTYVEALGFILQDRYFKCAVKVECGEFFPGTKLANRFANGSYVLDRKHLLPFDAVLIKSKKTKSLKSVLLENCSSEQLRLI